MWYAPVLQIIGYMYDCFPDPKRNDEYYLVSDPTVSCELPVIILIVHIHTGLLSFFVGLSFPIFIAVKISSLKTRVS